MLTVEEIERNVAGMQAILQRLLDDRTHSAQHPVQFLNNLVSPIHLSLTAAWKLRSAAWPKLTSNRREQKRCAACAK